MTEEAKMEGLRPEDIFDALDPQSVNLSLMPPDDDRGESTGDRMLAECIVYGYQPEPSWNNQNGLTEDQVEWAIKLGRALEREALSPPADDGGPPEWLSMMPRAVVARYAFHHGCREETRQELDTGHYGHIKLKADAMVDMVGELQEETRTALASKGGDDALALLRDIRACRKPPHQVTPVHGGPIETGEAWSISGLTALLPRIDTFLQEQSR